MNATAVEPHPADCLSLAELRCRWQRLAEDRLIREIPGKVELNQKGAIEVSPASPRHAFLQALVAGELRRLRPDGATMTECPIETTLGIRVPDIAWASPGFMHGRDMDSPFSSAPELCIEVLSPTNSRIEINEKIAAYLAAGAIEVWLVGEDANIEMFDASGAVQASSLGIALTLRHGR